MKQRKNKNLVIGTLCALIIGMAVGYSVLGQILNINGTSQVLADFNIQFTKIDENTMVNAKTITKGGVGTTTANFTVDLEKPGSSAIYDLTVSNLGSIDAVLKSIEGLDESNLSEPLDIKFSLIGIEVGEALNAGESKMFQVKVDWDSNASTIPSKSKKLVIKLNYEQKGGTSGGSGNTQFASDYLIKNSLETDVPSGGNGLVAIDNNGEITTSTSPRDYRYIGPNPDNYVMLGNETVYTLSYTSEYGDGKNTFAKLEDCKVYAETYIDPNEYTIVKNCEQSFGPSIWRIIGIFDGQLKMIKKDSIGFNAWNSAGINDWSKASLQTYLNGEYLNSMDRTVQESISDYTWKLGGYFIDEDSDPTVQDWYEKERGTDRYDETRPLEWTGKIALMYPSDFGFATSGEAGRNTRSECLTSFSLWNLGNTLVSECKINSWLLGDMQWTLTPASKAFYEDELPGVFIQVGGILLANVEDDFYETIPSLYLNKNVEIVSGTGTEIDPFILK